MSVKLYRNGTHSANILLMNSIRSGNTNPNFFKDNFYNHIKDNPDIGFKFAAMRAAEQSPYVLSLGLRDWGEFNELGFPDFEPRFPFRIVFSPQVTLGSYIPQVFGK